MFAKAFELTHTFGATDIYHVLGQNLERERIVSDQVGPPD